MFNFFYKKRKTRNLAYSIIPVQNIKSMINDSSNILIDVRTLKEYNTMHIINAVNIPVDKLVINESEYKNKKAIILYCSTGARTKEAIKILNNMGYSNIYIWMYGSISNFPFKNMIKV